MKIRSFDFALSEAKTGSDTVKVETMETKVKNGLESEQLPRARSSVGKSVCLLTKKANPTKLLLSVAYGFSFLKSRPQLYRSYTEFASPLLPSSYLQHTGPSDARALFCQFPTALFTASLKVCDDTPGI